MKKTISTLLICTLLSACSTTGGMYDKNDPKNNEFSAVRTILTGVAVIGLIYGASQGGDGSRGGGPTGMYETPKWDYQPGNRQWVCRNANNGQYLVHEKCGNQLQVDNWP